MQPIRVLPTGTNVSKNNHYFYWFERLKNVDTVFNRVALPESVYVAEELANVLQTSLNNASWFGENQYTCTYNQDKQAITILQPTDNACSFFYPVEYTFGTTGIPSTHQPNDIRFRAVYNKLGWPTICNGSVRVRRWNEHES